MSPANLKDVARLAGVHTATASRALNERTAGMVSPETVERVRDAADALGYRVNRIARGLKMRRSFTVGMLIPDITNPFFPRMVRGAEDSLHEAGFTLVLADTDNDPDQERRHRDVMLERQVDGLLLATARRRDRVVDGLIAAEVPFVLVNRTVDRGRVAAVIPDDRAGMALAVEHLYAQGHRRIGQRSDGHVLGGTQGRGVPEGPSCPRAGAGPDRRGHGVHDRSRPRGGARGPGRRLAADRDRRGERPGRAGRARCRRRDRAVVPRGPLG